MAGASTECKENLCPHEGLLVTPAGRNMKSGIPVPVRGSNRRQRRPGTHQQTPLQPTQEKLLPPKVHHTTHAATPITAQPVTHNAPTTPQTSSTSEDDAFKEDKSSLAAILNNQPIPACGSAVRATIATTPSQHKTRTAGYRKMPWDDDPNFLARHSVYARRKRWATPSKQGTMVDSRVQEAMKRIISSTISRTNRIVSRTITDEEKPLFKPIQLTLEDHSHSSSPLFISAVCDEEAPELTPSVVRSKSKWTTAPQGTTSTITNITTPTDPLHTRFPIDSGHMAHTESHHITHTGSSRLVPHRLTCTDRSNIPKDREFSTTRHPTAQDGGHRKQAFFTSSSSHYCSVAVGHVQHYNVDDELSMINSRAPKPAGLSRSECANPIGRKVLQNRFQHIS